MSHDIPLHARLTRFDARLDFVASAAVPAAERTSQKMRASVAFDQVAARVRADATGAAISAALDVDCDRALHVKP